MAAVASKERILASAEHLFDRNGFHAVGMDAVAAQASVSTRTLYKHARSKTELVQAVLERRRERFFASLGERPDGIEALFVGLAEWFEKNGAYGCLFLRAISEFGDQGSEIPATAHRHEEQLRREIRRRLQADGEINDSVVDQLVVLFEGATSSAVYLGPRAALVVAPLARSLARPDQGNAT